MDTGLLFIGQLSILVRVWRRLLIHFVVLVMAALELGASFPLLSATLLQQFIVEVAGFACFPL
jgi:hypothetical protein